MRNGSKILFVVNKRLFANENIKNTCTVVKHEVISLLVESFCFLINIPLEKISIIIISKTSTA